MSNKAKAAAAAAVKDPFAAAADEDNNDPIAVWSAANREPLNIEVADPSKAPPPQQFKILQRRKTDQSGSPAIGANGHSAKHQQQPTNGHRPPSVGSSASSSASPKVPVPKSIIGQPPAAAAATGSARAAAHDMGSLVKMKEEQYQKAKERIFGPHDADAASLSPPLSVSGHEAASGGSPLAPFANKQSNHSFDRHELSLSQLFEMSARMPPIALVNVPGVPRWLIPPPPAVDLLLAVVGDQSPSSALWEQHGISSLPPPPPFPIVPLPPPNRRKFTPLPAFNTTLEAALESMTLQQQQPTSPTSFGAHPFRPSAIAPIPAAAAAAAPPTPRSFNSSLGAPPLSAPGSGPWGKRSPNASSFATPIYSTTTIVPPSTYGTANSPQTSTLSPHLSGSYLGQQGAFNAPYDPPAAYDGRSGFMGGNSTGRGRGRGVLWQPPPTKSPIGYSNIRQT
ncbi:hypothetical protein RI367_006658 [Sorochytrium milnesiophthora]